jgi:hypothetical protein
MPLSNYPGGFNNGLVVRGMPVLNNYAGSIFWVDSNAGADVTGRGTFSNPFKTLDYAIGRCTANNGDEIHLKPGHAENISAAGTVTADVAGISIIGHGRGTDQPKFSWTVATATFVVSAANVTIQNVNFSAAVADVTIGLSITATGDDAALADCYWSEAAGNQNWVVAVTIADGANGLKAYNNRYVGNDVANDNWLNFAGTHTEVEIVGNRCFHKTAQTATAAFIVSATALNEALIAHNYFYSASAAVASAFVVLTGTANTGVAAYNSMVGVDTDATASNGNSAFDVTGLGAIENYLVNDANAYALIVPQTADDLT